MSKTYSDIVSKINTKMRNSQFSSDYESDVLEAVNDALDSINIGDVGANKNIEVGYDFQRETRDILFTRQVTGTITTAGTTTLTDSSATFLTSEDVAVGDFITNSTDSSVAYVKSIDSETQLTTSDLRNGTNNSFTVDDEYTIEGKGYAIASSWNHKFPIVLRLAEDSDVFFEYRNPEDFKRKKYAVNSTENMFTIEYVNNTQVIKINYDTTEALLYDFFSNDLVVTSEGTRQSHFANDSDILLIPDRFYMIVVWLACAELSGQMRGWENNEERNTFLSEGRRELLRMINNIGQKRTMPRQTVRIRNSWQRTLTRTSDD